LITISLFGIALLTAPIEKFFEVFWAVKLYVHLTIPSVSLRVCQIPYYGATLF